MPNRMVVSLGKLACRFVEAHKPTGNRASRVRMRVSITVGRVTWPVTFQRQPHRIGTVARAIAVTGTKAKGNSRNGAAATSSSGSSFSICLQGFMGMAFVWPGRDVPGQELQAFYLIVG